MQTGNVYLPIMESEMESIDISSIQAAALRPIEADLSSDRESLSTNDRLKAIQSIFQRSVDATHADGGQIVNLNRNDTNSQPADLSQSLLDLPSTVPDSQAIAHVEQILQETPSTSVRVPAPQVMQRLKKMNSQGVPQDTQPLSPEFLASLISKSRRAELEDEETSDTPVTLYPGDEGHIDLLSSYRVQEPGIEEHDESELADIEFSPTQAPPSKLSQFPESQRFKTPGTTGRKRRYNGDLVESPLLPRNPLARNKEPTPGRGMGLSQIFEATQAPSSPFVNGLPSELRSDRPSPAIPLQQQPMSAAGSSPLQPRSLLPRSSAEPQTKYVSIEEEQALREARERLQKHNTFDDEESSFDNTPDEVRRRRRKRRRDEEADRQFAALDFTSPVDPKKRRLHSRSISPPQITKDAVNESEEETDQEDIDQMALGYSSQTHQELVSEHDKENFPLDPILIPETVAPRRMISDYATEVQASPLVGHGVDIVRSRRVSQRAEDPESVVVVNSQRSESRRYNLTNPVSSGDQTDFVPQSQYPSNGSPRRSNISEGLAKGVSNAFQSSMNPTTTNKTPAEISNEPAMAESAPDNCSDTRENEVEQEEEEEEPPRRNLRSQSGRRSLPDTIPETSSGRPTEGTKSLTDHRGETAKSMSEFETAPSHPLTSTNEHDSAPAILPSQAASLGPARLKRKRMDQIDAEESQRSNGPDINELNPVLVDDEYNDIMLNSSPVALRQSSGRRRISDAPSKTHERLSSSPLANPTKLMSSKPQALTTRAEQELKTTQGETPPASSDEIRGPIPRNRGLRRSKESPDSISDQAERSGKGSDKPSTWDIQSSPEEPSLTRSGLRAHSLRKPSSTIPTIRSPLFSAAHQPKAATQATKPNTIEVKTPLATTSLRPSRAKSRLPVAASDISPLEVVAEIASTPINTSHDGIAPGGDILFPNQVFACYNGTPRGYFPATCIGVSDTDDMRYQVQWEGYTPDEVDKHGVRSLDLRQGDLIKIILDGFPRVPHIIRGFKDKVGKNESAVTDIRGYKAVLVALKQRKSLPAETSIETEDIKEAPISSIYLDWNMWNQMKERPFTYTVPPSLTLSTRPHFSRIENSSTPSTPGSRNRRQPSSTAIPSATVPLNANGCFANMAFAISYENDARKVKLTKLILKNGGVVLRLGFHELFLPDSVTLKPQYANFGFTALIADKFSTKEKYLQALALALPCLSGKWVEACTSNNEVVDWQHYLLPAGESDELEGAVRSRTLAAYETASARLADVIESRPSIFDSVHALFVIGTGRNVEKRRPYVFLSQALGACHMEKTSDIIAAKALFDRASEIDYKWLFVDDDEVEHTISMFTKKIGRGHAKDLSIRIVGNEFLKQSLILGRMFEG